MNSGTAEQEQNGVTIPRPAAPTVSASSPRPTRVYDLLGREEAADERDDGDDPEQEQEHLRDVKGKERDGIAEVRACSRPSRS